MTWRSYGIAAMALAGALLLRLAFDPWLGDLVPFVTVFGAVAVGAWAGGTGPALLVAAGGYLVCAWWFIPPRGEFQLADPKDLVAFATYMVSCLVIIAFGRAMRRAQRQVERTAESLVRERERLDVALRAGGLGIYEWQVGRDDLWWSPEVYALFGVSPSGFRPTLESFGRFIHADDAPEFWRRRQECVERGDVFSHEYRVVRPDGQVRWMSIRAQVSVDAAGRAERMTGVVVDITDRMRSAETLQRLNEQLREADRRKDEFLATLAHELRNPLAPIRNAVQILKSRGPHDPKLDWSRDVIDRQVGHMARLLEDLLDVSRITRGKLDVRKAPLTLQAVIESALETSRPAIESRRHRLDVALPAGPVQLEGDAVRLSQVFGNLLNNAAKYTEPGGHIELAAHREGGEVVVIVRDNGMGIDAGMRGRLFQIFSQAQPALERAQGGLGIGLALVKGLVELHGGSVAADSEGLGRGSVFTVRLPLVVETAGSAAGGPPATQPPVAVRRKVLVVDDNRDSADTLRTLLELMGCEVRVAYDGEEALDAADTFRPQVILLDLGMPRVNGYEACERIRGKPCGQGVRMIALTGWGQDDDRRRTARAGFDAHLVKPVDPEILSAVLQGTEYGARTPA